MADVIVLSRDATLELVSDGFVGADINGSGQFVFTTKGGDTVNIGQLAHSELSGLTSGDPHTQYAKSDGTRGSFATTTQGTKADNARVNLNSTTAFNGGDVAFVEEFNITIDGSPTGDWVDRMVYRIRNGAGSYRKVTYFNEYGEFRSIPARHNTVASRWFVIEGSSLTDGTARDDETPIMELMDDRTSRHSFWAVMSNGDQAFHNDDESAYIRMARTLVLEEGADVPDGTPAGTVIVRIPA